MIPPPEPFHTDDCDRPCTTDHAAEFAEAWREHREQLADDDRDLRRAYE